MPVSTKISNKTSQQVVSPVVGAILGFYYRPLIGFLVALAFGFQESPFKLKTKYFGCKINWQLFLIYFVIGLAGQVLDTMTLFLGLLLGVGVRWYLSDGDLAKYNQYFAMGLDYFKDSKFSFNHSIHENTDWIFKYLQKDSENIELTQPSEAETDPSKLDHFLQENQDLTLTSEAEGEGPFDEPENLDDYQVNPSISSGILGSPSESGTNPASSSLGSGGISSSNSSPNSGASSNPSGAASVAAPSELDELK